MPISSSPMLSSSIIMPLPSSPSPSSLAEQSIPQLSTPRSLAFFMLNSPILAPSSAQATICPSATFGAPQTICKISPASTLHTCKWSLFSCSLHSSTFATTTLLGTLIRSQLSTSRPISFSAAQISSADFALKSIHSFNQFLLSLI